MKNKIWILAIIFLLFVNIVFVSSVANVIKEYSMRINIIEYYLSRMII